MCACRWRDDTNTAKKKIRTIYLSHRWTMVENFAILEISSFQKTLWRDGFCHKLQVSKEKTFGWYSRFFRFWFFVFFFFLFFSFFLTGPCKQGWSWTCCWKIEEQWSLSRRVATSSFWWAPKKNFFFFFFPPFFKKKKKHKTNRMKLPRKMTLIAMLRDGRFFSTENSLLVSILIRISHGQHPCFRSEKIRCKMWEHGSGKWRELTKSMLRFENQK